MRGWGGGTENWVQKYNMRLNDSEKGRKNPLHSNIIEEKIKEEKMGHQPPNL